MHLGPYLRKLKKLDKNGFIDTLYSEKRKVITMSSYNILLSLKDHIKGFLFE